MKSQDLKKFNLPDEPGVYFFRGKKKILYIGKATSLYDRVRSYFFNDLFTTRGPWVIKMIQKADSISFKKTDSVLEALILEANYIKKFKPIYNTLEKDDKSFNYVVITKEKFPQVYLIRGKELFGGSPPQIAVQFVAGPFPNGSQLKEALKIIRKIFPYRDQKCIPYDVQMEKIRKALPAKIFAEQKLRRARACFNRQIRLCPGVCTGEISHQDYKKTIRNLILFFQGRKRQVVRNLARQMKELAKNHEFEKAEVIKRQIFSLNHIRDVSLLKNQQPITNNKQRRFRIEGYDIAHISGKDTVGVMVVMEDGELAKNEYRKFKIRGSKGRTLNSVSQGSTLEINDTKNLKEILTRRFRHAPPAGRWPLPNLIVVDGGVAQINTARKVLVEHNLNLPTGKTNIEVVSVVKDDKHKPIEILGMKENLKRFKNNIIEINSEAHRFAVAFHRNRRRKGIFE